MTDPRGFLRTHARVLEVRLAEFYLDGTEASGLAAIAALEAYRNDDGGFGHGLEADARAPSSQPLAVDFAFGVLDELATTGSAEVRARAVGSAERTLPYLATVAAPSGGLRIVLPAVAEHPRAEHWGDGEFPPALNPTASIVGVARALGLSHPWLATAAEYCRRTIDAPGTVMEAHTALCVLRFCETEPDRDWAEAAHHVLGERLHDLDLFQLMPGEGYGLTPLDFAPTPESPRRAFFEDKAVDAHLDALAAAQLPDAGWLLTWDPPGPAAVLAWRGVVTLHALRVLRAYGR